MWRAGWPREESYTPAHMTDAAVASSERATLARAALDRGFERMVLQVEAGNATALRLYARCGFTTAWAYGYWEKGE
jgi:ribosomal protein S18 acetylase RimI-like enzyme